jgi:hypothetical protein
MLCDALKQNFIDYSIKSHQKFVDDADTHEYHQKQIANLKEGICNYEFVIESGRKYHKIIMVIDNGPDRMGPSRSVHAFVDKKTGQIYKSLPVGNLLPKVFATISALLSRGSGCCRMPTGHLLIFMLAEDFIMYSFKPSASGDYVAAFDVAATVIINSLIKKGAKIHSSS